MFLENNGFCRKSGNDPDSRGAEASCCLCHNDTMRTKIDMLFSPNVSHYEHVSICNKQHLTLS